MAKILNASLNEIWISHSRIEEESSLSEGDAVSFGKRLTTLDPGLHRS